MTISGFDVVFFTLLLVVPGYLAIEVRNYFKQESRWEKSS